jgi:thymidylate kinase
MVGTDGSGKSTLARNLRHRLEVAGFQTHEAYFGMARGNLPGVGLARRILAIPAHGEPAGIAGSTAVGPQVDPERAVRPGPGPAGAQPGSSFPKPADHRLIRRAAAWFYAAEYQWRYLSQVAPARCRGAVVICDRYVYDLRESPWPGSRAARLAQWVMPDPDLLVLPDAPAELIHARKPERPLPEQAAQQQAFRDLLAAGPARVAELLVDTSGADPHPELAVAAAVIAAAHDPGRRRDASW